MRRGVVGGAGGGAEQTCSNCLICNAEILREENEEFEGPSPKMMECLCELLRIPSPSIPVLEQLRTSLDLCDPCSGRMHGVSAILDQVKFLMNQLDQTRLAVSEELLRSREEEAYLDVLNARHLLCTRKLTYLYLLKNNTCFFGT